jgi:ubiquinone/menaquinone biosynthesis C-methylase UbiE
MSDYAHAINQHYGQAELGAKILTALRAAGKNLEALTRDDLVSFDEQHDGGREGTRELARLAGLRAGMHVLDIGSGLGGPARTLAAEYSCQVTGLDLTEEACQAAEMLTSRVGLSERVTFRQGDALHLPFDPGSFDVVWTQYALMNIADKTRLVQEAHRVLRPEGLLVCGAIMAGPVPEIHFPVFWANDPTLNFLSSPEAFRHLVIATGFTERAWEDVTAWALDMGRRRQAAPPGERSPLGLHVVIAGDIPQMLANVLRNFEESRTVAVRVVYQRTT